MASQAIENLHNTLLDKLLSDSGVVCIRPAAESMQSSSESRPLEEQAPNEEPGEASPEQQALEEEKALLAEGIQEELPDIFPSPSLRRVLPERIRKMEEHNRIHVLPEEFKTDIDPALIPKIAQTAPQKYIDVLAEIVGCTMYKSSLAEFWFLDTLANLLRRAQEDELDRQTQAVLILWFCEWMKEMQHFDAADRKRMLRRFEDNMLSAARYIATEQRLPTPAEAGVMYRPSEDQPAAQPSTPLPPEEHEHEVTFGGAAYECSLSDLTKILHYIFDLFSTDYQYNLVRSIFTFPPGYVLIDTPYQIQVPKRLYAPLKPPKKAKSPKPKEKGGKNKKKEVETEEYLALLELMARDEREQEEKELLEMEEWNRRSHILPLQRAVGEALLERYWPPPEPEPEPEPAPEAKAKPKGKGKK